jgi:hypothetical protein
MSTVQRSTVERAGHASRVAQAQPATCATLDSMSALLTSRLHIDLQRTCSAVCSAA